MPRIPPIHRCDRLPTPNFLRLFDTTVTTSFLWPQRVPLSGAFDFNTHLTDCYSGSAIWLKNLYAFSISCIYIQCYFLLFPVIIVSISVSALLGGFIRWATCCVSYITELCGAQFGPSMYPATFNKTFPNK